MLCCIPLFVCLFVCLSVCLSVCLLVCDFFACLRLVCDLFGLFVPWLACWFGIMRLFYLGRESVGLLALQYYLFVFPVRLA